MAASPWVTRTTTNRRLIRKELRDLWADPPASCRPGASPVTDLLHWEVVIDGPDGTPYAGGTFPVDVRFPDGYPFVPPKITFKTKVFHPNIDSEGEMVLDILQSPDWSPALRIEKLLRSIVSVLYDPLLDFPISGDIADLYTNDTELYEELAAAWTREHSSAPVFSHYPNKEDELWLDHCDAVAAQAAAEKAEAERLRRLKAEEERLRRREAEDQEKRRAASRQRGTDGGKITSSPHESLLSRFLRRVLAFLFRDGPLPCHLPRRRSKLAQE